MSAKQKTILDEFKLRLTTKPLAQGAKPPALVVNVYRNNPQLTVFTGHDNGSGKTMLSAGFDVITFSSLMEIVRWFAQVDTPPGKVKVDTLKPIPKEMRTDPKVRIKCSAETWIGKDDDGKIWISVVDPDNQNAPKIKFYFEANYYHKYHIKADPAIISAIIAKSWANVFENLVAQVLHANGQDPQNTGSGSGGNSGGGYQGGNKSYGGNKGGYQNGGNKSYGNNNGGGGYKQTQPQNKGGSSDQDSFDNDFDEGFDD